MPDYRRQLPEILVRNEGQWIWHEAIRPGVYKHVSSSGEECITVRVLMPPSGVLSSETYRRFADLIDRYAAVGRRTSRNGFEFVGVAPDGVEALIDELAGHGFPVGGTGPSLRQIKGCVGFAHCQSAAIDPPSLMKAIADRFFDDALDQRYPAPLKISISGCPNHCAGGVESDIGIVGAFRDVPEVDPEGLMSASCDLRAVSSRCPTDAMKVKPMGELISVEINPHRCVRCGTCASACPSGITMPGPRGVRITVGGVESDGIRGPRLAMTLVPFIPVSEPLAYEPIITVIERVVSAWKADARAGERVGDYMERRGWLAFREEVGL